MQDILFSSSPIDLTLSLLNIVLSITLPLILMKANNLNSLPRPLYRLALIGIVWNGSTFVGDLLFSQPGPNLWKTLCFGTGALAWIQLGNTLHHLSELTLSMKRHFLWNVINILGVATVVVLTILYCVIPESMCPQFYSFIIAFIIFVISNVIVTAYKMFKFYLSSGGSGMGQNTFFIGLALLAAIIICLFFDAVLPIAYKFNIGGYVPRCLQWAQYGTVLLMYISLLYFIFSAFKNRSAFIVLGSLCHRMGDAVLYYNNSGRIIYSNPAAQQLFQGNDAELRKKKIQDLLPELDAMKPGNFADRKIQINNELHTFNVNIFTAQQSLSTQITIIMLIDQTNQLFFQQRISTLNRQFTEYKQDLIRYQDRLDSSEKKSHETENLNATLINALPFQFWSKNENGVYVMQNNKDIAMRTNLNKTTDSPEAISKYESAARSEGVATLHTSYEDENHNEISEDQANLEFRNGHTVFVYQNHFIPVVENRPPYKIIGLKIDISEETRMERERNMLREQKNIHSRMEELGTICGAFAHDYNNILGSQINFSVIAREMLSAVAPAVEENEKAKKFLGKADHYVAEAHKAGLRGKESLNVLLDTIRGNTSSKIADTIFAAAEIVHDVTTKLTVTLPPNILINSEELDESLKIKAQAPSLDRILSNLSNNAIYAMKETGGTLTFKVAREELQQQLVTPYAPPVPAGEYVKISVSDTGTGMDSGTLERIFAPFFTTKAPGEGLGLGLSSAVRLLKEGNAYFTVQTTVGEGTTFNLYWHLYKEINNDTKEP